MREHHRCCYRMRRRGISRGKKGELDLSCSMRELIPFLRFVERENNEVTQLEHYLPYASASDVSSKSSCLLSLTNTRNTKRTRRSGRIELIAAVNAAGTMSEPLGSRDRLIPMRSDNHSRGERSTRRGHVTIKPPFPMRRRRPTY